MRELGVERAREPPPNSPFEPTHGGAFHVAVGSNMIVQHASLTHSNFIHGRCTAKNTARARAPFRRREESKKARPSATFNERSVRVGQLETKKRQPSSERSIDRSIMRKDEETMIRSIHSLSNTQLVSFDFGRATMIRIKKTRNNTEAPAARESGTTSTMEPWTRSRV